MSIRSIRMPVALTVAITVSLSIALFSALALAPTAGASMKGSYYQAMLKEKKSKSKATKATKAAMKGNTGFYGFRLKSKYIPAKHGSLIWSKVESGKKRHPDSSRTLNVLYASRSLTNRKIPVSGTVMLPKGKAPRGGWPVVSWAHGTTGIADQCAPSRLLGRDGYYSDESGELTSRWLKKRYAVVATDYEGLGTPGIHPYLIGNSEGRGVLDIVTAARQLDSRVSKRVALAGHSQGGQAILFAADLAPSWGKGTSYLGTVAYAPASNFAFQAENIGALTSTDISALALMIVRGMVVGDPSINAKDVLTDAAQAVYAQTDRVCYGDLAELTGEANLLPAQLLKRGWATATVSGGKLLTMLEGQNPALTFDRPVLIPQGLADSTVPSLVTDLLIGQLDNLNPAGRVTYDTVPGATHSSILLDSWGTVDPFIGGLFNP